MNYIAQRAVSLRTVSSERYLSEGLYFLSEEEKLSSSAVGSEVALKNKKFY